MRFSKWRTLNYAGWLSLSFAIMVSTSRRVEADQEALAIIADFAERLCGEIPQEGSEENLELSGEAKAELSKLIRKLADLGIKGAGRYQQSQYQGVLQEDLAAAQKDIRECRIKVLHELKSELLDQREPENVESFKQRDSDEGNQPQYYPPAKVTFRSDPGVFSSDEIIQIVKVIS